MKKGWAGVTLGEVVTLQRGFDLPKQERLLGPYPVIASTGPVGKHNEAAVKGPGVVIGRSGSIGGGQFISGDFWPLNTTLWVKDFKGNDPKFCYYLLKSLDLAQFNAGSGVPTLNRNHIHPLPVSVPPADEQRDIGHVLGTLDEKIELNRRKNETLEAMARALFKSWFVDFEPVQSKMDRRWRRGESLPGLPTELYDLFPDRLVDSELGEIPEGWEVKTIGGVIDVVGGTTPSTKKIDYWQGGTHCWATPKDLSNLASPVLLDTERKITDAGLQQIGSGLLPRGTLLLSSRAPIGYLAISEMQVAVNQGIIGIPPHPRMSNFFMLRWCEMFHDQIVNYANGSTFLEISKRNFRLIPLVVPKEGIMDWFDRKVRPLHQLMVSIGLESASLVAQRDTLLPKLISGEIRLSEVERDVEVVA